MFHLNASASALRQMLACSPLAASRRLLSTRPERLIAAYRVRKPEALLELSVRHAKFRSVGAQGNFFAPAAEGSVRLALSPAGGAPLPGAAFPPYDYAGKIYVDVSALDIVTVIQSPIAQPVRGGGAPLRLAGLPVCAPRGSPPPSRHTHTRTHAHCARARTPRRSWWAT
jgi:hypothetical protein